LTTILQQTVSFAAPSLGG